jgi:hypothetical protein
MARGTALTDVEKFAIQGMLEQSMSVTKIATKLRRSDSVVRKFIDENLKNTETFIDNEEGFMPADVEKALHKRLLQAGLAEMDAKSTIKRMKGKMTKKVEMSDANIDGLVRIALGMASVKDLLITKAQGGQKGVAIMTEGASQRFDDISGKRRPRDVKDHIFRQEDAI